MGSWLLCRRMRKWTESMESSEGHSLYLRKALGFLSHSWTKGEVMWGKGGTQRALIYAMNDTNKKRIP